MKNLILPPLIKSGARGLSVQAIAKHAGYNEGLVTSWLKVTGPKFGIHLMREGRYAIAQGTKTFVASAKPKFIITPKSVTISAPGFNTSLSSTHPKFKAVVTAAKKGDLVTIKKLTNTKDRIHKFLGGRVEIMGNSLKYKGKELHNLVVDQVLKNIDKPSKSEPLIHFMDKVMTNPSVKSIDQLYSFLSSQEFFINKKGNFIGFKRVTTEFMDFHTKTVHNKIGATISMPREKVDSDPTSDCSHGYHVGNIKYVNNFHSDEGHILEVEVDPQHCVSVPTIDTNKLRVCQYKVLRILKKK